MEAQLSSFILATGHYLKGNVNFTIENIDNALEQLLLAEISDVQDETSALLSHFFHSLYWLLQSFADYNCSANKCVDVLIKLCSNDNIRKRLVKNMFFIPVCNFLSNDLTKDDKYKLLKLIDQLSVDTKLAFVPENIHKTLDVLSTWVLNQNELISAASLQVLANMSYRNENIQVILNNTYNLKLLYKHCIKEMDNSINAIKLLVSIKVNECSLPRHIFTLLTYDVIFGHLRAGNVRALRETIDMFFDIKSLHKDGFALASCQQFDLEDTFIKYLEEASRATVTGAQLAAETMRFLRILTYHNIPALFEASVAIRLANVAFIWCSNDSAALVYNMDCAQIDAILLLLGLIDNSSKILKGRKSFFKVIEENWSVLRELVLSVAKSNEHTDLHLALVRLMRTLVNKEALREYVVEIYETYDMTNIFNMSASQQNASKSTVNPKDVFFDSGESCKSVEHRLLILYTVALLVDISHSSVKQLLTHAQIHNVLTQILFSKNDEEGPEVKATVCSIIQSGYLPLTDFSKSLFDMPVYDSKIEPIHQIHYPRVDLTISKSGVLRERLDTVTAKIEETLQSGQIDDSTTEMILYYNLRISEAETSEAIAKENLSGQLKNSALLEQRIQRYNMERDSLSRVSLKREQILKSTKKEVMDLTEALAKQVNLHKAQIDQLFLMENKFSDGLRNIDTLRKELAESRQETKASEIEKESLKRKYEADISKSQNKNKKLEKELTKQRNHIENLEKDVEQLKQSKEEVENNLLQCQDELNKKTQACAQRGKDLIEIQKEKEALLAKIQTIQSFIQSNFSNMQRIFN